MVDPSGGGQGSEVVTKQGKLWTLLIAVAATLVTSLVSVGLQAWNTNETRAQRETVARESKRYAYRLFISQAHLTANALENVVECRDFLEIAEHPSPPSDDELPSSVGGPGPCSGLAKNSRDLPSLRAAYEQLFAGWAEDYRRLAEPRKEMLKHASGQAVILAGALYILLGNSAKYDEEPIDSYFVSLRDELCRDIPEEC